MAGCPPGPTIGFALAASAGFSLTLPFYPCITISFSIGIDFAFSFTLPSFSFTFFFSLFLKFNLCDLSLAFGLDAGLEVCANGGSLSAIVEDPSLDEQLQVAA